MKVLEMNLSAAALIIVIVIIRALAINKLPKRTFLVLWGIVLCRLFLPLSIQSSFSAYNAVSTIPQVPEETNNITTVILNAATWMSTAANPVSEKTIMTSSVLQPLSPLVLIWLTGTILMAAFFLVTHLRFRREYKTALPVNDCFANQWLAEHPTRRKVQLRQSDQITSPLTYGILRPVILLPKTTEYTEAGRMQYILTHEFIHIKRFDTLKKWLLASALCIHWFNPFVWVMYILANRDIELSCDEAVVRIYGETKKSFYALTLIGMEETKSKFTPLCNNFSKNAIEERITAIMKIEKTTIYSLLVALALVVGITVAFATSAVEAKAVGLLGKVLGDEAYQYEDNINKVMEPSARVVKEDYTIYLDSTIFTDNHVYALIGSEGSLPENLDINGSIVYAAHDQTIYGLTGESKEIEPGEDGKRYFLYSAVIAEPGTAQNADPKLVLAAGDNFLKHNSLRDHAGDLLEITISLDGNEHILMTPVANVSTNALIFHPDAARYDGDFFDTIILTPFELKMAGSTKKTYESYEEWDKQLYFKLTLVLVDGTKINMSYDSRGTVFDDGYPLGMSRGQDMRSGEFYHWWNFRDWELDLSRVTALIVDGATYYAAK
jgi:beta-lactamase regulating signal transducer with metallopeptidase domain